MHLSVLIDSRRDAMKLLSGSGLCVLFSGMFVSWVFSGAVADRCTHGLDKGPCGCILERSYLDSNVPTNYCCDGGTTFARQTDRDGATGWVINKGACTAAQGSGYTDLTAPAGCVIDGKACATFAYREREKNIVGELYTWIWNGIGNTTAGGPGAVTFGCLSATTKGPYGQSPTYEVQQPWTITADKVTCKSAS